MGWASDMLEETEVALSAPRIMRQLIRVARAQSMPQNACAIRHDRLFTPSLVSPTPVPSWLAESSIFVFETF
jgi:hypothetical protein